MSRGGWRPSLNMSVGKGGGSHMVRQGVECQRWSAMKTKGMVKVTRGFIPRKIKRHIHTGWWSLVNWWHKALMRHYIRDSWILMRTAVSLIPRHHVASDWPMASWVTLALDPQSLWTDRHTQHWKHYFRATSFMDGSNNGRSEAAQFSSSKRQSFGVIRRERRQGPVKGLNCVEILSVTESRIFPSRLTVITHSGALLQVFPARFTWRFVFNAVADFSGFLKTRVPTPEL